MTVLNEDTMYRASSQFRLWSFTPETLSSLRQTANDTASEHVRKRRKPSHTTDSSIQHVEPLTVADELHALQHIHLPLLIRIAETYFAFLPALSQIISTASQYLRRYYLTTSLMAPAPSQGPLPDISAATTPRPQAAPSALPSASTMIVLASLYLAIKVHDLLYELSSFVERVRDKGARDRLQGAMELSIEGMKRTEQALTRTLRFCFDVRHAGDGVKGLEVDLNALLQEGRGVGSHSERVKQAVAELLKLRLLGKEDGDDNGNGTGEADKQNGLNSADDSAAIKAAQTRIRKALASTASLLGQPIHATDAYFLYSPSQILFAALMIADEKLAEWYLGTKFPVPSSNGTAEQGEDEGKADMKSEADPIFTLRDKVFTTIRSCAEMLRATLAAQTAVKVDDREVKALEARLNAIQDLLSSPVSSTTSTGAKSSTATNGAPTLGLPDIASEDNSEASRETSVKRGSATAGFSSSDEEEDDDVVAPGSKGRKKRRRIEDDDVFGPML